MLGEFISVISLLWPPSLGNVHLFLATPAEKVKPDRTGYDGRRYFVRTVLRKIEPMPEHDQSKDDLAANPETEYAVVQALDALEIVMGSDRTKYRFNHLFFNVLSKSSLSREEIESLVARLARRYGDKLLRLNVMEMEFDVTTTDPTKGSTSSRFVCRNETGVSLEVETYEVDGNTLVYKGPKMPSDAVWNGKNVLDPIPVYHPLDPKRQRALSMDTIYCYDFLTILEKIVRKIWSESKLEPKHSHFIQAVELVLDEEAKDRDPLFRSGTLKEVLVAPGKNTIGMVAWKVTLYLPECGEHGRDVIFIANDITFQAGTFGVREDLLFLLASQYARQHGLPRVYLSANSGARIGLATEVMEKYCVQWKDDDPLKGPEYLYLTPQDYQELRDSVVCEQKPSPDGSSTHWVLKDIIGRGEALGVENLSGSGLIAGETSLAYEDVWTLTYVTARSVGIGAYLARLGQRCIQKVSQPLLLTGYNALNKLLGKQVYSSNQQLGGPDIMFTNGVSHLTVTDDLQGVQAIVDWLRYVPARRGAAPFVHTEHDDPVDRPVSFRPTKVPYDPRLMLAGSPLDSLQGQVEEWVSGFFDQGSWMELLRGWAASTIVGRARLGGLPMGVIAVETRQVDQVIPADPASASSKELVVNKAGQVWYPDSAYKTAQAINDMRAEDLPLIIFANWRGFSGGMTDMFNEVLKFGSLIVDALRVYEQPIFIYIPPEGTVRGGAWVVLDATINERHMEMYAAPEARGGVLEVEGTLDVKYRAKAQLKTAHRIDPVLSELDFKMTKTSSSQHAREAAQTEIRKREKKVASSYHQAAGIFCDLHDTPGRMIAKGVIRKVVKWEDSRRYFYWRLRRKTVELEYTKKIEEALGLSGEEGGWKRSLQTFHRWVQDAGAGHLLKKDKEFYEWTQANQSKLKTQVDKLHGKGLQNKVRFFCQLKMYHSDMHFVTPGHAYIPRTYNLHE